MGPLPPIRATAALLALAVLATAAPAQATPPPAPALMPALFVQAESGLRLALDAMRQLATDSRSNKGQKRTYRPRRGLPVKLGSDGRLTVLLAGSDWRPGVRGERLDVVMVATIDPQSGKAALVSIPRDTAGIPLAGGGNSGAMRINSIYYLRYRDPAKRHRAIDRRAMKRFTRDVAAFLGTEIDYWAMTRFATFTSLINSLGGVRVDVDDEVLDSSYHHNSTKGVWFPRRQGYKLRGDPDCKPKPRKCRSALVYVRSRKGTHGDRPNSDWTRAERQQELVRAAVRQVVQRDGGGIRLLGRLLKVRDKIETNLPKTAAAAAQLYAMAREMKLPRSNMKVLAPATWAGLAADGTTRPNVGTIRRWVNKRFYKVEPATQAD